MQPRGGDRKAMAIFNALIAPLSADLALPNRLPGNGSRFMRLPTARPMSGGC